MTARKRSICASLAAALMLAPTMATTGGHGDDYAIGNLDDLEFVLFGEGPLMMSVLWGDPATGPSGFLLKIPAGFEAPLHSHTATYKAVILDGNAAHWIEGETKDGVVPVTDGGYWVQPGGQLHGDANIGTTEGLALIVFDGPVDFLMPE